MWLPDLWSTGIHLVCCLLYDHAVSLSVKCLINPVCSKVSSHCFQACGLFLVLCFLFLFQVPIRISHLAPGMHRTCTIVGRLNNIPSGHFNKVNQPIHKALKLDQLWSLHFLEYHVMLNVQNVLGIEIGCVHLCCIKDLVNKGFPMKYIHPSLCLPTIAPWKTCTYPWSVISMLAFLICWMLSFNSFLSVPCWIESVWIICKVHSFVDLVRQRHNHLPWTCLTQPCSQTCQPSGVPLRIWLCINHKCSLWIWRHSTCTGLTSYSM